MNEHLDFFLLGAAPIAGVLIFLLLALLVLRRRARKKSKRMSKAEREMTGLGATTWEGYHGPATLAGSTVDPLEPPEKR
jgi:ABC-type Fe3+ transport system permease subunit